MRKLKTKKLTETQDRFCELYSKYAGNISKICIEMNISTPRASQFLENPLVKERLSRAVQIAKERIEASTPHLVNLALEMVNDENLNPKIRASLLDSLLDRGGVAQPKDTPLVQINLSTQVQDRARQILAERIANATPPTLLIKNAESIGKESDVNPTNPND